MDIFRRILRLTLRVAAGLGILLIILMTTAQIVLSPKVCTSLINKYVPYLVDGRLQVKSASVSLFSHFPAISADIDSVILTYPSERFDSSERCGAQSWMVFAGTPHLFDASEPEDTLAKFSHLQASINVLPLITGRINVKKVELSHPRVFLHFYADGKSNLDIFKFRIFSEDTEEQSPKDTGKVMLPPIKLRKVALTGRPAIVVSSQKDSLFTLTTLKEFSFSGNLDLDNPDDCHFSTRIDSLLVAGSIPRDTLSCEIECLEASASHHLLNLEASAGIMSATRSFGRIKIPIKLSGPVGFSFSDGPLRLDFHNFGIDIATIYADLNVAAEISDSISLKGRIGIPSLKVGRLLGEYASNFYPPASNVHTGATLSLFVDVDGALLISPFRLPKCKCSLDLPRCSLAFSGYDYAPDLELHASGSVDERGSLSAAISSFNVYSTSSVRLTDSTMAFGGAMDLRLAAAASDILGKDPLFHIDASLGLNLDKMQNDLEELLNLKACGKMSASVKGDCRLSDLTPYNFPKAKLEAAIESDGIHLSTPDDSLEVYASFINAGTDLKTVTNPKSSKSTKALSARFSVDSVYFRYGTSTLATGRQLSVGARMDTKEVKLSDSLSYCPLFVFAKIGSAKLRDSDSIGVRIINSNNFLFVHPPRSALAPAGNAEKQPPVPVINLTSRNERISIHSSVHRIFSRQLDFTTRLKMNPDTHKKRVKQFMDSLYAVHPDWNKDSVKFHYRQKAAQHKVPDFLSEEDFKKADFNFDLGQTFKTYFNRWDVRGKLTLDKAGIATPAFPLKTRVSGFQGSFDNDHISLDSLTVVSGASDLKVNGEISDLRNALIHRQPLKLGLAVNSDSLALDELIAAYTKGCELMSKDLSKEMENAEYSDVEARIESADLTSAADNGVPLVVLPANLIAEVGIGGHGVRYAGMDIHSFGASIKMRERCLLLENLNALSNLGNVYLDAFYSTKTKAKVCTGFNLTLEDISAGQVIELIPSIDTLMPLLKTFDGKLNCSIAATSKIDSCMNLVLPSIDGVIRISGEDLHFQDDPGVKKIAKLLMFKNPERATIDSMVVEGVLKNNMLEVFPFYLKMDRWQLALAGVHNLDQSFRYHISVVKSPLIFRFGVNFSGPDFDNLKISLGKPKYKPHDNLPVFTTQIDSTRINLVTSIRNVLHTGAEIAVREHEHQMLEEEEKRKRQDYDHSVAFDTMETLPSSVLKQIDTASVK